MLFGYQPPAAMSMMGQGVAEGMAKAGELYGKGLQSFGEQIGAGIQSAAGAYANAQDANKTAAAVKKFAATMPDVKTEGSMGYMLNQLLNDPNLSNAQVAKFGTSAVSDYFKNMMDLRRIQEINRGRLNLQAIKSDAAAGGILPPLPMVTPSPLRQSTIQSTEAAGDKINFNTSRAGDVDLNVSPFSNPYPRTK